MGKDSQRKPRNANQHFATIAEIVAIEISILTVRWAEIKWTSKKHEKYYHSIKVCTLGGHNPLCLKSYKIRTPMKIFKKPNFKMKW